MPNDNCCVCGQPGLKSVGRRWFCDEHYQSATKDRSGFWRSTYAQVGALVVFVGLVYLGTSFVKPAFTSASLLLTGAVLAIVPALIWLSFFYQQDRLEPEPKGNVLAVFALGALLATAVGGPLVENVFRVSQWLYADTLTTILGSILVVGFVQEFLKYAAVRYSVYSSTEFDEATDGVIYATAAGLGYATVLNIGFVMESGGVDLGVGVIRVVVTALAQASFAGILGYFLGRAKFESEPIWWMPLGLTLAAVANGLFNWLRGALIQGGVSLSGSASNPWLGLILAAAVALATTGVVGWLIRRNITAARAAQ